MLSIEQEKPLKMEGTRQREANTFMTKAGEVNKKFIIPRDGFCALQKRYEGYINSASICETHSQSQRSLTGEHEHLCTDIENKITGGFSSHSTTASTMLPIHASHHCPGTVLTKTLP